MALIGAMYVVLIFNQDRAIYLKGSLQPPKQAAQNLIKAQINQLLISDSLRFSYRKDDELETA